jgi:hypothetical protein
MDQGLTRSWDIEEGISARRCFAQPRPNRNDKIGGPHSRREAWPNTKANVSGVERVRIVEQILMAKRTSDR